MVADRYRRKSALQLTGFLPRSVGKDGVLDSAIPTYEKRKSGGLFWRGWEGTKYYLRCTCFSLSEETKILDEIDLCKREMLLQGQESQYRR